MRTFFTTFEAEKLRCALYTEPFVSQVLLICINKRNNSRWLFPGLLLWQEYKLPIAAVFKITINKQQSVFKDIVFRFISSLLLEGKKSLGELIFLVKNSCDYILNWAQLSPITIINNITPPPPHPLLPPWYWLSVVCQTYHMSISTLYNCNNAYGSLRESLILEITLHAS